jgi:hypothetical protein
MLNDVKTLSFSVFINGFRGVRKVRARTVPDSPYIHYYSMISILLNFFGLYEFFFFLNRFKNFLNKFNLNLKMNIEC